MRLYLAIALAGLLAASAPAAADDAACAKFKWPLDTEKSWFAAEPLEQRQSGADVAGLADGAFLLTLVSQKDAGFVLPPEGKPKAGQELGATVRFADVQPGRYQVTLSSEAWIDMVQNGSYGPSLDFSGVHGCDGLRKSVRFELEAGALVLQLSAAKDPTIKVAIRRSE